MRRTLQYARVLLLVLATAGTLAGCAAGAGGPANRGWDAPAPDAVLVR